jgi:Flp pilus assembly protein TadG
MPAFFLVLFGIIVTGVVVMNQVAFNNALRDVSRAAAVCGTLADGTDATATLPDGTRCSPSALRSYLNTQIDSLHGGASFTQLSVSIVDPSTNSTVATTSDFSSVTQCVAGKYTVQVSGKLTQPLYLPLVGVFLGNNNSHTTRQFTGSAGAGCER